MFLIRTTLILVYCLIFVGGLVRSTGSGMGCPDWPKCFDMWIPPLYEYQLPHDYQEIYKDRGYQDTQFNAAKTWTEYLNRLLGAVTGIVMLVATMASFKYWRRKRKVTLFCTGALLLTITEGALGAKVVFSHLAPYLVTMHLLLAFVIVALLILALYHSKNSTESYTISFRTRICWGLCMGLTILQVILGAQVREGIEHVSSLSELGYVLEFHQIIGFLIFACNSFLVYQIVGEADKKSPLMVRVYGLWCVILLEIACGIGMVQLGMPALIQPVHLLFAAIIFGVQVDIGVRVG
ncbi:MAG: COX15/CtaA family protein, partial [Candidatus Margulisbacteria bacterium]|nr:COX15/CtaA family protein [Candidatus Margulisiibacteriota bacterium]